MKKAITSLVLVILVLGGAKLGSDFLASYQKKKEKSKVILPATTLFVQSLKRENFQERFPGYAKARSMQQTDVSAEVTGLVVWVSEKLKVGQEVEEGEVLVRLDDRDFQEAILMAQADLAKIFVSQKKQEMEWRNISQQLPLMQETLKIAKRELTRLTEVAASSKDIDSQYIQISERNRNIMELQGKLKIIKMENKSIIAEKKRLDSILATAKNNLSRSAIHAPYKGDISAVYVEKGTHVTIGAALFQVVDAKKIELSIALGSSHFHEINKGALVEIKADSQSPTLWKGEVVRIAPIVDSKNRTFKVFCEILEEDSLVAPGAVYFALVNGKLYEDVFVIPRMALVEESVFVANLAEDKEMYIQKKNLEITRWKSEVVIASSGVEDGDLLAITNLEEIAQGSKVIAINKEEYTP